MHLCVSLKASVSYLTLSYNPLGSAESERKVCIQNVANNAGILKISDSMLCRGEMSILKWIPETHLIACVPFIS